MSVMHVLRRNLLPRQPKRLQKSVLIPKRKGGINKVINVLHFFAYLFEHAEHHLAEHKQINWDQLLIKTLNVATNMEPARIPATYILGLTIVNAGDDPHIVQSPHGRDF